MHQVHRKCGQCCPYLNKIVHTCMPIGTLFTYTVYVYCLPLLFKCGQYCPHFGQIVHTFWGRVHCSHKTLFTYLTESVDKIVHTFIKLFTISRDEFYCSPKKCSHKTQFTWLFNVQMCINDMYCSPFMYFCLIFSSFDCGIFMLTYMEFLIFLNKIVQFGEVWTPSFYDALMHSF